MERQTQTCYAFGPFRVDPTKRILQRDGENVPLTPKCLDTLLALIEYREEVISKDELMRRVWRDTFVEEGNLTYNISVLRKALGERAGEQQYIVTIPGRGYRFVARVSEVCLDRKQETEQEQSSAGVYVAKENTVSADGRRKLVFALVALLIVTLTGLGWYVLSGRTPQQTLSVKKTIRRVAVLPLTNGSGDPDAEYISDGISESLINSLSQMPGLKVIARSSSFKYKGKAFDPRDVAQALGVEALLMGHVAQRGENLLISVELIDGRDETQIWGEQYNRKMADLQVLQVEMARTISQKLRLRLTDAQEQRLAKRATENPRAYEVYLNGLFSNRKDGIQHVKIALDYYNEAIALDPNFAPAYVRAASCYENLAHNSMLDPQRAKGEAKAALQRALELDERLAEAHAALAVIKTDEWDWVGVEQEIQRALEIDPNLAKARKAYAWYLSAMGRHEEALAEIERAQELDPLAINLKTDEGFHLFLAERYAESIEKLQQTIKLEPDNSRPHVILGFTYAGNRMYAEAIAEHQKAISLAGETSSELCYLGYALAKSGQRREALSILAKLNRTKEYLSPYELATLHVGLGDKETALVLLEKAYAAQDLQMQYLKVDSHMSSLRADPRFIDLMLRVGLPQ